jgi:histidinol phosphatase-like PHP family hydrolase
MKLDLHTHCHEATRFAKPNISVVKRIITAIKEKGLDGIAITDHNNKNYAFQIQEIVQTYFDNEIIIIPGQELDRVYNHIIELYLPDNTVFRFIAHPGTPSSYWANNIDNIHGIEINNGNYEINHDLVKDLAKQNGLLLLSNSDAHSLSSIGKYYNEIDLSILSSYSHKHPHI